MERLIMLALVVVAAMAGLIAKGALTRTRPFRSPHHSASMAALTGGESKVSGRGWTAPQNCPTVLLWPRW